LFKSIGERRVAPTDFQAEVIFWDISNAAGILPLIIRKACVSRSFNSSLVFKKVGTTLFAMIAPAITPASVLDLLEYFACTQEGPQLNAYGSFYRLIDMKPAVRCCLLNRIRLFCLPRLNERP
jgi:hypothetical protein